MAKGKDMVMGYLIVDRSSGLVRAWRRDVIQAFSVSDDHKDSIVMLVRIPRAQEVLYLTAEVARPSSGVPEPEGEFVRTIPGPAGKGPSK